MIRRRFTRHGSAKPAMSEPMVSEQTLGRRTLGERAPDECRCAGEGLPALSDICTDPADHNAIILLRFVLAAYAFNKPSCIEGAMDVAGELFGEQAIPIVMGRLLALVRSLRAERQGNFHFLPGNCSRISEDEMELAEALMTARGHDREEFELARTIVARTGNAPTIGPCIWMLAATLGCVSRAGGPLQQTSPSSPSRHFH